MATQHRHEWAACVAAAFAAAEGQAATAIRTHLIGPEASVDDPTGSTASAPRSACFTNYEQIVPLDACPHHNQLLLVYVHPSHLQKVTLLSIAKSRLGSYCCRDLQHSYKQQWGLSTAAQQRLRQQWEQRRKQQKQQQQQQRMDLFFNFGTFFGFSDSVTARTAASDLGVSGAAEGDHSVTEAQAEANTSAPMDFGGISKHRARRQQRVNRQRLRDLICCNTICSIPQTSLCCVHPTSAGSIKVPENSRGSRIAACGCEVYKEVFAYGGMAARLLIGATPVVVACVDLKLTEDALEPCGKGISCRFCRTSQQHHMGFAAAAATTESESGVKTEPSEGTSLSEEEDAAAAWHKLVICAVQRQQLLTILAE